MGLPLDVHENDQRRMNTKTIHFSRDMLWNDLTSEPRDVFELYRATTDPRIDAKGVMPIPGWLVVSIHAWLFISMCAQDDCDDVDTSGDEDGMLSIENRGRRGGIGA